MVNYLSDGHHGSRGNECAVVEVHEAAHDELAIHPINNPTMPGKDIVEIFNVKQLREVVTVVVGFTSMDVPT